MNYLKLKMTLALVIISMALFIVSCEQAAVDNYTPNINETANLSTNDALVNAVASDQSHQDILERMNGVTDDEERASVYVEYLDNVLFVKYPELAEMQKDDALDIVFQAVSQMDVIELRCGCHSNCHFCCGMAIYGNRAVKQCFKYFCGFKRTCH